MTKVRIKNQVFIEAHFVEKIFLNLIQMEEKMKEMF